MFQSNNQPAPATLLPAVAEAVSEVGAMIRAEFHHGGGPRGSGSKAPVDTEVELVLKDRLLGLHSCSFVGEETGRVRASGGDVWVVDPQDGTTDFLAGRRGSAISVALLRAGRPILGVVFAPLAPDDRGDLIAWAEGDVLTRNGSPVRRPSCANPPVIAMNAQASNSARHNHEMLHGFRIRAIPSPAYRLALAAVGEVDAAVSLVAGLDHWDIAGGHALLIGAGLAAGRAARSDSQSNGALMRVSPIGILAAGDPELAARLAAEDARLTHPHPVCQAASAAFAAAIATGVAGGSAEAMCAAAESHAGRGDGAELVRERLALARRREPEDYNRQMGWVLIAFQNAFHHLMQRVPLCEAVVATVARGGDTDTNGAICGALLGASQGRGAIPMQWRNAVLTCRPVEGRGIRHPRPQEYWPDDALDLAEALLAARTAAFA